MTISQSWYARSITIAIKPELAPLVAELHETASVPLVAHEPGFVLVLGLIDPLGG